MNQQYFRHIILTIIVTLHTTFTVLWKSPHQCLCVTGVMLNALWWMKGQWGLLWSQEEPGSHLLVCFSAPEAGADAAVLQEQMLPCCQGRQLAVERGPHPRLPQP